MFSKLFSSKNPSKNPKIFSQLIISHSEEDARNFLYSLQLKLGYDEQILLILYYTIIYCSILDRLLSEKVSIGERSRVMNLIIDDIKNEFTGHRILGDTAEKQGNTFEYVFNEVFSLFGECETIMGESENQIPLTASKLFAAQLIEFNSDKDAFDFHLLAGKEVSKGILRLISEPLINSFIT